MGVFASSFCIRIQELFQILRLRNHFVFVFGSIVKENGISALAFVDKVCWILSLGCMVKETEVIAYGLCVKTVSLCLGSMSKNAESTTNKNGIFS